MKFKAGEKEAIAAKEALAAAEASKTENAPIHKEVVKKSQNAEVSQDDLFTAHDFDITIDLEVPLPGECCCHRNSFLK